MRQHDVQQDYETLKFARTEVRQLGPALVAVVCTDADTVRLEISNGNGVAGAAARLARQLRVDGLQTVHLTNVKPFNVPQSRIEYQHAQKTMALVLAQRLHLPLYQRTAGNAYADMRIVLGHDIRYLK
ncbi:LytR cell envelope-related transcriptional attenuator [Duganella sacchari]|uniref:LytR cell envelope-related transcriptional attenuator n=1 Tax=Duganella sacchari TaxID=551987 RepID=A0A1M7TBF0_9BURK|nr:LytR cell envelope-related transcriptional attenuator [Duganella sacchari]